MAVKRIGSKISDVGKELFWVEMSLETFNTEWCFLDINDWCKEQYGVFGLWFIDRDQEICFHNEEDRLLFLLRWS